MLLLPVILWGEIPAFKPGSMMVELRQYHGKVPFTERGSPREQGEDEFSTYCMHNTD
jgi:hypothetical protein